MARMDFDKINYDLIEHTLEYIAEGEHNYPRTGSILVFLPGMQVSFIRITVPAFVVSQILQRH